MPKKQDIPSYFKHDFCDLHTQSIYLRFNKKGFKKNVIAKVKSHH